jgi:hypothetical protein
MDERFLRAHHTELVTLRVGKDSPGLSAGLSDVYPARPQREKAANLLLAIGGAAVRSRCTRFLTVLGSPTGNLWLLALPG